MTLTNFPNGVSSFGIPQISNGERSGGGSVFGKTYFVDPTNGVDGNKGTSPDKALATLTRAFVLMKDNDTVICAPGDYTGNHVTPLNSVAPFCSVIGMQATALGLGPFAAATDTASPILSIRARGWRVSGFEFDGNAVTESVLATTSGTSNANFLQMDHCLFTGGSVAGIDYFGAPTFSALYHNGFTQMTGGSTILCSDASTDTPRSGHIYGNRFWENINHIAMNPRGFKDTVIEKNTFMLDGVSRDALVMLDTRGGGGNQIIDNYFDITQAQFTDDAATAFIRTAATDYGAGNHLADGEQNALISV